MKLMDKYLLRSLLVPWLCCLAAFALVYVVYDLFDNLGDFVQGHTPWGQVALYYVVLMPSVLVIIVPISLLLAVLYCLSSLTKNNELTAMRASGVSLPRLAVPFLATGFALSLVVATVHETVGPWSAYWCDQFVRAQRHKGTDRSVFVATHLAYKNERAHRIWLLGTFDTRSFEMGNVDVLQQRPDGSDARRIQAEKGLWLDGHWWFFNVAIQDYDSRGAPMGPPQMLPRLEMTDFRETPQDFLNEVKEPPHLSSREIARYLRVHRRLSPSAIARVRVDLHHRLAMPWTCFLVTLLGIPFGITTGRKGAFVGVALSLTLFFGYYVLVNLGLVLGKKEAIEPWVAAWGPNLILFGLGLGLFFRMPR